MVGVARMSTPVTVIALLTEVEVGEGAHLAALIVAAAEAADVALRDGDVVCVASKVVAKAEGAWLDLDIAASGGDEQRARRAAARALARHIVVDTDQVLVVQTSHGFVTANGGIDASNVPEGRALRLPDDPDASAARIRADLRDVTGTDVGVVITDTFGRPWRMGQVEVALGVAGTAALRDERGSADREGRPLDVTMAAIADQVASAADLVRTKASGTPFVLVRGLPHSGADGTGQDLVRPATEDLFRHAGPNAATAFVTGRRTVRAFRDDPVPDAVIEAAVAAAITAPAPHHTRPWRFIDLTDVTRAQLLDAMADAWRVDLRRDGLEPDRLERRIARSDAILRTAPRLLAPFVDLGGAHPYDDDVRATGERDLFLLSGGAALQGLQIVLAAHGFGAAWLASTAFCPDVVRDVLDLPQSWAPLGMIAIGRPAAPPVPRPSRTAGLPDHLLRL